MKNDDWKQLDDYAVRTVTEQRDQGNLIASFLLCSAFIEHYCEVKLFSYLTRHRPIELYDVRDTSTKKQRKAFIWSKMKRILEHDFWSQRQRINLGLLVGAWNKELFDKLANFNKRRSDLVHQYEILLQILDKDEKEVRDLIDLGLSLLPNIKKGCLDGS
jgi:hypothetical protein